MINWVFIIILYYRIGIKIFFLFFYMYFLIIYGYKLIIYMYVIFLFSIYGGFFLFGVVE